MMILMLQIGSYNHFKKLKNGAMESYVLLLKKNVK